MNRDEEREEQTRPDIEIPVDLPTAINAASPCPEGADESSDLPGTEPNRESTGSVRVPQEVDPRLRESLMLLAERIDRLEQNRPEDRDRLAAVEKATRSLEASWTLREALDEEQSSRLELVEARLHGGAHRDSSEFRTPTPADIDEAIAGSLREQEARLRALEHAARNRDDRLEALEGDATGAQGETVARGADSETAKRLEAVSRQVSRLESDSSERFGALEAWRLEAEMALEGVFPPDSADQVFSQVDELRARVATFAKQLADAGEPRPRERASLVVSEADSSAATSADERLQAIEAKLTELDRRQRDAQVHVGRLQQRLEAQLLDLTSRMDEMLSSARSDTNGSGGLRRIRGVGPKFERLLHEQGVRDLAAIASWTEADVDRIAPALGVSAARIRREGWVEHAKALVRS